MLITRGLVAAIACLGFAVSACGLGALDEPSIETDPFVIAAGGCDLAEVERLVAEGRDPLERRDTERRSSILATAIYRFWGDSETTHQDCVETIQFLLDAGADPSALDDSGLGVPYFVIVGSNEPEVLELFDPTMDNWCTIAPVESSDSIVEFALEDDEWDQRAVDTYLSGCE